MGEDRADLEGYLRLLTAEALLWAHPQRPLFPVSLGVMAVANALGIGQIMADEDAEQPTSKTRSSRD